MQPNFSQDGSRDFLAEAARLALQIDPLAWEFDLSDRGHRAAAYPTSQHHVFSESGERHVPDSVRSCQNATEQSTQYLQQQYQGEHLSMHNMSYSGPLLDASNGTLGACLQFPQHPASLHYQGMQSLQNLNHNLGHSMGLAALDPTSLSSMSAGLQMQPPFPVTSGATASDEWKLPQIVPAPWSDETSDSKEKQAQIRQQQGHIISLQNEVLLLRREKEALESHAKLLELALLKASKQNGQHAEETADFIPSRGWTKFDPASNVILNLIFDPPKRISADEAANIPLREYGMLWTSYLKAVRECIDGMNPHCSDENDPKLRKLKALLSERHGFFSWVAANNPSVGCCLLAMDMGSDPPTKVTGELSSEERHKILTKMQLSNEQSDFLLEARNQFLLAMGYHSAALKRLQESLANLNPEPKQSVRDSRFLQWLSIARSLQETVDEIHICNMTFHCQLYKMKRGISPYQAAVLMIESYPYLPDVIALMTELASNRDAPSAEELFQQGAKSFNSRTDIAKIKFVREPHPPSNNKAGKITMMLEKWEALREANFKSHPSAQDKGPKANN